MEETLQPLRPYDPMDTLKQFLDHDRHVLRFYCYWDDRDEMFGDVRYMIMHYYLADDTIEVFLPSVLLNRGCNKMTTNLLKQFFKNTFFIFLTFLVLRVRPSNTTFETYLTLMQLFKVNFRQQTIKNFQVISVASCRNVMHTMRVDLSPRLGGTQWPIPPPPTLLSSSHSPSSPRGTV